MKNNAMLFMQRTHEVAHLRAEHAVHRPLFRRHHVNLDAARAQGRCRLQSDKARADHNRATCIFGLFDDGAAISARSQRQDLRLVGARNRQSHRFGARCQQQPIVGPALAAGDRDLACVRVDADHLRTEMKLDAVFGVELIGAERHPILWRVASEIILREVGPIHRGSSIVAEHDDATAEAAPPQHLGRRKAGRTSADNHNSSYTVCRAQDLRFWLLALFLDEDSAGVLLHFPALDRAQGRCAHGLAGAQIKAGVMPRASNSSSGHETFCQRSMIVRAMGADGEQFRAGMNKQHFLLADMPNQPSINKISECNAVRKVGTGW